MTTQELSYEEILALPRVEYISAQGPATPEEAAIAKRIGALCAAKGVMLVGPGGEAHDGEAVQIACEAVVAAGGYAMLGYGIDPLSNRRPRPSHRLEADGHTVRMEIYRGQLSDQLSRESDGAFIPPGGFGSWRNWKAAQYYAATFRIGEPMPIVVTLAAGALAPLLEVEKGITVPGAQVHPRSLEDVLAPSEEAAVDAFDAYLNGAA